MTSREDWMRRLGPLYGGAVAIVRSTPWPWPTAVADDARTPGWIVAVGAPIGAIAWCAAALAHAAGLPATVAALFGLAALSVASAGLVERGAAAYLAEHARTRARSGGAEDAVAGSVAVIALVTGFVILIRAAAFVAVPPAHWLGVLVATALAGRFAAIFLQAIGDPIDPGDGDRLSLVATPAPGWLAAALGGVVAVVLVVVLGRVGVAVLALIAVATFAIGLDAQRRPPGLHASTLAVAAAIAELLVLLAAAT